MDVSGSTQRNRFHIPYTTATTRACQYCSKDFNVKGLASHEKACKLSTAAAKRDREFELRLEEELRLSKRGEVCVLTICLRLMAIARLDEGSPSYVNNGEEIDEGGFANGEGVDEGGFADVDDGDGAEKDALGKAPHARVESLNDGEQVSIYKRIMSTQYFLGNNLFTAALLSCGAVADVAEEDDLQLDDIKIEYHHSSKRKPVIAHFQDFSRARDALNVTPDEEPYRPFYCRNDFEFARIAMDAALKPDQVNALIKLINSAAEGAEFTLSGHGELMRTWKKASDILTPVFLFPLDSSLYCLLFD